MNLLERVEVLFLQDRVGSREHGSVWFKPDGSDRGELESTRRRNTDERQRRAFRRALTEPLKEGIEVLGQPIEEL